METLGAGDLSVQMLLHIHPEESSSNYAERHVKPQLHLLLANMQGNFLLHTSKNSVHYTLVLNVGLQ